MEQIYRFFAEKKEGFDVEAQNLGATLKTYLHLDNLKQVRIINRYDIAGLKEEYCEKSCATEKAGLLPTIAETADWNLHGQVTI